MEIIGFYNCADHYEARKKEQEFFISLNATLNSIEPLPKPKLQPNLYQNNNINLQLNDTTIVENNSNIFYCEKCNYSTYKKFNFNLHFTSKKHKNNDLTIINDDLTTINNDMTTIKNEKITQKYTCKNCDKLFNDRAGLWRHNKNCKPIEKININNWSEISQEFVLNILKQNSDFQQIIIEQNKTIIELSKKITHPLSI